MLTELGTARHEQRGKANNVLQWTGKANRRSHLPSLCRRAASDKSDRPAGRTGNPARALDYKNCRSG